MNQNLTTGSVGRNLLFFSLPYLLSYFLQTLYGMADLWIIGQFEGVASTTAVSIGSQIMHMIFDGIKAGNLHPDLEDLPQLLHQMKEQQGVEAFVLGCTELPILFDCPELRAFSVLDPTLVLARAAVLAAGGQLREEYAL